MSVGSAVKKRHSVRAFLPEPIPRDKIENILRLTRTAPSGANLQPGKFYVLTGSELEGLKNTLTKCADANAPVSLEYSYFPNPMPKYLKELQRKAGYALYSALEIERRDIAARRDQFRKNYEFFNAPVGIVITVDKNMGKGCFMDLGMALQNLFLLAEEEGLAACGIGAIANYGQQTHEHLGLGNNELVVCGIALGLEDKTAKVNQFRTERLDIEQYAEFRGFED